MARFPAWVGGDGYPLSWGHFVIGVRQMREEDARGMLQTARGTRLGNTPKGADFTAAAERIERGVGERG